jgi:flagellar hook assembly protein FlgD
MSSSPQWKSDTSATNTHVRIDIFNIRGQLVRTLVNGEFAPGEHSVVWNGTDCSGQSVGSGVYFYRMTVGEHVETNKMILMK